MTLAFSQRFPNGSPTYFIEKIYSGFERLYDPCQEYHDYYQRYFDKFGKEWNQLEPLDFPSYNHKIHTIRRDSKNRWREGMDIHFVINNRTKDRFQFAPIVKVKKIQKIDIVYDGPVYGVYIDDELLLNDQLIELAKNDGFDSVSDFLAWFSEDFTGKIIHWTDFSY